MCRAPRRAFRSCHALWSALILVAEQAFVPTQWERDSVRREAVLDGLMLGAVGGFVGTGLSRSRRAHDRDQRHNPLRGLADEGSIQVRLDMGRSIRPFAPSSSALSCWRAMCCSWSNHPDVARWALSPSNRGSDDWLSDPDPPGSTVRCRQDMQHPPITRAPQRRSKPPRCRAASNLDRLR